MEQMQAVCDKNRPHLIIIRTNIVLFHGAWLGQCLCVILVVIYTQTQPIRGKTAGPMIYPRLPSADRIVYRHFSQTSI